MHRAFSGLSREAIGLASVQQYRPSTPGGCPRNSQTQCALGVAYSVEWENAGRPHEIYQDCLDPRFLCSFPTTVQIGAFRGHLGLREEAYSTEEFIIAFDEGRIPLPEEEYLEIS